MNDIHKLSEVELSTSFNKMPLDLGRMEASGIIDRLLPIYEVTKLVPKHRSTIYRWVKLGKFPRPEKREGSTFWKMSDVQKFIQGPDYQDNQHTNASSHAG